MKHKFLKDIKPKAVREIESLVDEATLNENDRTIWFTAVSKSNAGLRETYSGTKYYEAIDVDSARLEIGTPFSKDHHLAVDNIVGRVEEVQIEDNEIKIKVRFSETDTIFDKFKERILTDVSIGYRYSIDLAEIVDNYVDEIPLVTLREVEIYEVSAVWSGFDADAIMGREESGNPSPELEGNLSVGADLDLIQRSHKMLQLKIGV